MPQVLVRHILLEDGCHVDGSHSKTVDFDLRVIEFAQEKAGFELSVEDAQRMYDARESHIEPGDESVITEIANDACNYLSEVTEDGWHWYITDQSLFLGSTKITDEDIAGLTW